MQHRTRCRKIIPAIIILCFALKGKCVLVILQVVNAEYQVRQCAMLSLWHHLAALLVFLLCTGKQLYKVMKCKCNGLCNLNIRYHFNTPDKWFTNVCIIVYWIIYMCFSTRSSMPPPSSASSHLVWKSSFIFVLGSFVIVFLTWVRAGGYMGPTIVTIIDHYSGCTGASTGIASSCNT